MFYFRGYFKIIFFLHTTQLNDIRTVQFGFGRKRQNITHEIIYVCAFCG